MQTLVDKILENRIVLIAASVIALLLALALIVFIFRLAFGRRLKAQSGGRTRLPRLGVVDAFDLDRQRQLVIIRRDNVEHLLMIGGPNDVVIEAEIIRAEARDPRVREKDLREKDARETAPVLPGLPPAPLQPGAPQWQPDLEPAPVARTQASPAPAPVKANALPPLESDIETMAPIGDAPSVPPLSPPPAPRTPVFPPPPRRTAAGSAPRPSREAPLRPDYPARVDPQAGASGAFPRAPLATPFLRASPPRGLPEPAVAAPPVTPRAAAAISRVASSQQPAIASDSEQKTGSATSSETDQAPLSAAESQVADDASQSMPRGDAESPQSGSPTKPAADSLAESLEEEMARLLGRGP